MSNVCLRIQCSSNHRRDASPFPWSFPPRPGGGVGGCFGTRAGSGGRTDEVEDVDLELGAALGRGGCFGAGFAFAFAFAEAAVSCAKSGGTGVSAIASTWASVM